MSSEYDNLQRMNRLYVEGTPLTSSDVDAIEWAVKKLEQLRKERDEARELYDRCAGMIDGSDTPMSDANDSVLWVAANYRQKATVEVERLREELGDDLSSTRRKTQKRKRPC